MNKDIPAPSFWKRVSATWIDFALLLGAYLVLGYVSEHIFLEDAYPPATGMQLYSERDFAVYWFFVRWTLILTSLYLLISYRIFGGTLGQKLVSIKLLNKNADPLTNKNIFIRLLVVVAILLLLMVPGPIAAIVFIVLGSYYLNTAFSVMLLLVVISALFYVSFTRYNRGKTRSFKDKLSQTIVIDIEKVRFSELQPDKTTEHAK